jgi:hypothetical protein
MDYNQKLLKQLNYHLGGKKFTYDPMAKFSHDERTFINEFSCSKPEMIFTLKFGLVRHKHLPAQFEIFLIYDNPEMVTNELEQVVKDIDDILRPFGIDKYYLTTYSIDRLPKKTYLRINKTLLVESPH